MHIIVNITLIYGFTMLYRDIPRRSKTLACLLNNLPDDRVYVFGFVFAYLSTKINVLVYNIETKTLDSNYELDVKFALEAANFAQMSFGVECTDTVDAQKGCTINIPFYKAYEEEDLSMVKELLERIATGSDIDLYTQQSGNRLIVLPQIGRLVEQEAVALDDKGLARLAHLIHKTGHSQAQIDFDIKDEIFVLYNKTKETA